MIYLSKHIKFGHLDCKFGKRVFANHFQNKTKSEFYNIKNFP